MTQHIKSTSVNVQTGETTETYYTEAEWDVLEAARIPAQFTARQDAAVLKNKSDVGATILALYPEWKQRNMIARMVELTDISHALTTEELAEYDALAAIWEWVKAQRAAGNVREEAILQCTDEAGLDALGV